MVRLIPRQLDIGPFVGCNPVYLARPCHLKVGTGFEKNDTHKQSDRATKQILRFVTSAKRIPEKCIAVFGQEYATKQTDSAAKLFQRLVTSARPCHPKVGTGFGKNDTHKQTDSATKQILRFVTSAKRIPEKCIAVFGQEYAPKQTDSVTKLFQRLVTSAKRIPEKCIAVFGQEYATKQSDSATKLFQRFVTSARAKVLRDVRLSGKLSNKFRRVGMLDHEKSDWTKKRQSTSKTPSFGSWEQFFVFAFLKYFNILSGTQNFKITPSPTKSRVFRATQLKFGRGILPYDLVGACLWWVRTSVGSAPIWRANSRRSNGSILGFPDIAVAVRMACVVLALGFGAICLSTTGANAQTLGFSIRNQLTTAEARARTKADINRLRAISRDYSRTAYAPIWIRANKPSEKADQFVRTLMSAHEHGLDPDDYDAVALFQKLGANNANTLADLEVHLSRALVAYAQHLNAGRLNPNAVNRELVIYPEAISPGNILSKARRTQSIVAFLRLLAPHTPRYDRLRRALADYRRIDAAGGFIPVPGGGSLKPGASSARVKAVARRLAQTGDLHPNLVSTTYGPAIVAATKRFQERHGYKPDGVVGKNTTAAMNVPVKTRVRQMELNLERRRWIQNDYGDFYLFANLADQVVKVVNNGKTIHAELIQVGQPYHRTPVFTDEIEYVEINPYWNVPASIAVNEYLPKLVSNPAILARQNIEVLNGSDVVNASAVPWSNYSKSNFPVRLRQRPGKGNALGRVKFMFPNQFNVYMHDTPSKSKFDQSSRYFSHGCLRLRDPLKMAEVLLGPQGWNRARIDQTVSSQKRTVVKLTEPIPIHVVYLTAWVNKDGTANFRRDIYGRDKILEQAFRTIRTGS